MGYIATEFAVSRVPVVNVASVPQRSPLRYPGGKTWFVPHVREWLRLRQSEVLIEPFAGGAIVALTAVMEDLVERALLIELDRDVAAFWRAVLEFPGELIERIGSFDPTSESMRKLLSTAPESVVDHGFRTLVLNRTRRGGILAPGASFSRYGEAGKGLRSRWYPKTLISRLDAIRSYAHRISFTEGDAMKILPFVLRGWGHQAAVFIDPPYSAKGGKRAGLRLYAHSGVDHEELFECISEHKNNFLMTYDAAPDIVSLVRRYGFHAVTLSMKNTHHRMQSEIVVTPDSLFDQWPDSELQNGLDGR